MEGKQEAEKTAPERPRVDLEEVHSKGRMLDLRRSKEAATQIGYWTAYSELYLGFGDTGAPPMIVAELPKEAASLDIAVSAQLRWYELDIRGERTFQTGDILSDVAAAALTMTTTIPGEQLAAAGDAHVVSFLLCQHHFGPAAL